MALDIGPALTTFALVLPAELPDKTFLATLVLATRLRPFAVWVGVAVAFAVQTAIAVAAGGVLALLPRTLVLTVVAVAFTAGAVIMLRSGLQSRERERAEAAGETEEIEQALRGRGLGGVNREGGGDRQVGLLRSASIAAVVLFAAEWGDLSQLMTGGLAARYEAPVSVFLGAWLALVLVAGLAVLLGGWLRRRVAAGRLDLGRLRLVSGSLLGLLAVLTAVEVVRSF